MNLHDVKNMSFADLKAQRTEIIKSLLDTRTLQARDVPTSDLIAAFVGALTDAKGRDEKLAEQGKTITALQDGLEASKAQASTLSYQLGKQGEVLSAELAETNATLERVRQSARETTQADKTALGAAVASLAKQTIRANRLKAEATRNYTALSGAAKLLNDAFAAQAVDNADKGE